MKAKPGLSFINPAPFFKKKPAPAHKMYTKEQMAQIKNVFRPPPLKTSRIISIHAKRVFIYPSRTATLWMQRHVIELIFKTIRITRRCGEGSLRGGEPWGGSSVVHWQKAICLKGNSGDNIFSLRTTEVRTGRRWCRGCYVNDAAGIYKQLV